MYICIYMCVCAYTYIYRAAQPERWRHFLWRHFLLPSPLSIYIHTIYIYIYIYICTHTHAHTHTPSC